MPPVTGRSTVSLKVLVIRQHLPAQFAEIIHIGVEISFGDLSLLRR
jgi:hypothetical protein